jgi:hypothetical protein
MAELKQYNSVTATSRQPFEATLLLNAVANTNGVWMYAGHDAPLLVTVESVAAGYSATVEIYGSTQPAKPADTDNFRVLLMSYTNLAGSFAVPQGYRWIKARITGYASGTIYAGLVASG